MKTGKLAKTIFCICLIVSLCIPAAMPAEAASGPTVTTTLTDGATQKGSRKTFDVWAKSASGKKIDSSVTLNGQPVSHTWDDSEKTSYTLVFTKEGENTVIVSAEDGGKKKEITYRIIYKKAAAGEKIGSAVWCVEGFTLGSGYIIPPIEVPVYEGETSAEQLLRLLSENGFNAYYGGSVKSAFYLAYIADGTRTQQKYNGYKKSAAPAAPRSLNINVSIPSVLSPHLSATMNYFEPDEYAKGDGCLGEFVITNGSGWMYCVNNNFPNVGFADTYLSDGDVVRVQFTLGYGADIGGAGAIGGTIPDVGAQPAGYYSTVNKDNLTKAICAASASGLMSRSNVKSAYDSALAVAEKLNASQSEADSAAAALNRALQNPSSDTQQSTQTPSGSTSSGSSPASGGSQGSQSSGSGSGTSQGSGTPTEAGKGIGSTADGDKTVHGTDSAEASETKAEDTSDSSTDREPADNKDSDGTDTAESARDMTGGDGSSHGASDDGDEPDGGSKTAVIIISCAAVLVAAPGAAAALVFMLKKLKAAKHANIESISEKAAASAACGTEIIDKAGEQDGTDRSANETGGQSTVIDSDDVPADAPDKAPEADAAGNRPETGDASKAPEVGEPAEKSDTDSISTKTEESANTDEKDS